VAPSAGGGKDGLPRPASLRSRSAFPSAHRVRGAVLARPRTRRRRRR
jgi:hypothetical protein